MKPPACGMAAARLISYLILPTGGAFDISAVFAGILVLTAYKKRLWRASQKVFSSAAPIAVKLKSRRYQNNSNHQAGHNPVAQR